SMGRIRKTGMHPILMPRPIPTYFLALGQMVAAFLSLMILAFLYFFPAGFILSLQYDIDFPAAFVLYTLLFYFVPGLISVLSITIWIRTCFKNNLMALIILGFIFAGMGVLANSHLLYIETPDGTNHNFVPLVSQFSFNYWQKFRTMEGSPHIVFTRRGDWFNLLLSLVYCNVFLVLSCYHLRRTEPQRRVLGTYGRHWYHAPTFVKMAADLKIDPHVTWRSHAFLIILAVLIIAKTGLPLARPYWQNYFASREAQKRAAANGSAPIDQKRYEVKNIPQRLILPIKILRDDQVWTPESLISDLTFTCNADTSGTLAILNTFWRWTQTVDEILLEGRRIPFVKRDTQLFIEGREFKSFSDGAPHHLIIRAPTQKNMFIVGEYTLQFRTQGYFFIEKKVRRFGSDGQESWYFPTLPVYLWHTRLTLTVGYPNPPVDAPVQPIKVEKTGRGRNALTTYVFDIPAELNTVSSSVHFAYFGEGRDVFFTLKNPRLKIRFVTEKSNEKVFREVMELAEPVLDEFCAMYGISPERTITITLQSQELREIRKMQVRTFRYGAQATWWSDMLFSSLDTIEHNMLLNVFMRDMRGPGLQGDYTIWDLNSFMEINITHGLNHRLSMTQKFAPREFKPIASHFDPQRAREKEKRTREELLENRNIPVFQMLYLVLGHDTWLKMLQRFKNKIHKNFIAPEVLQEAVRETTGDPMNWFFDYWMKSGASLPSYRVKGYRAWMSEGEKEDESIYNVEIDIANLGTGRMPVPVRLSTSKEPINDKIWLGPAETATWKVTTKNLPMQVQIDPDQWIMMSPYWNEKMKTWETVPSMKLNIGITEKK
ncbi:MAG: hypothetical protein NT106_00220, partial [Candidatus Sumerlaeota bacterium]|nr:hypothetical protein [Candidatus Sumerlaeota bacterium]